MWETSNSPASAHLQVLLEDGVVQQGHEPTAEGSHAGPQPLVLLVERQPAQGLRVRSRLVAHASSLLATGLRGAPLPDT